jgi:hypothetical protein
VSTVNIRLEAYMKRLPGSLLIAASLLAMAAFASAQQKPNFSGTWVTVSPAEYAGQEQTITQDDRALTIRHASSGADHSETFTLDGAPHKSSMPSHGLEIVSVSTASWSGDQLVVFRTTRYPQGGVNNVKLTFSLNADGHLVCEMTSTLDGEDEPPITVVARRK